MERADIEREEGALNQLLSQVSLIQGRIAVEERDLIKYRALVLKSQEAQAILQTIAQTIQQKAHERISEVVSHCLRAVFGEEAYTFKINFERKRGRTEAQLRFVRGDLEVDPITASGGGQIDVAAFALRIACLILHRPRLSQVVVLDEPFKFVSEDYQPNVRTMLEELSEKMGIQIIMVTHNSSYETGKIISLR